MKPLIVEGKSIAEVWENALIALWETHEVIQSQYDLNPLTGEKSPPSIDAPILMFVEHAMNEPKLHCCLEGGPAELAEYNLEVVSGIKNHWVKQSPNDTKWLYSYNDRLTNYCGKCNSASIIEDAPVDPRNPWVTIAYARKIGNEIKYKLIDPIDQIEDIVNQLVETPYTRRAIAITGIPFLERGQKDPPCLRTVTCRGFYRNGCLEIDMKVHFRSRDLWGAALFNMNALVALQKNIVDRVQEKFNQKYIDKTLETRICPKCGGELGQLTIGFVDEREYTRFIQCGDCGLFPYKVEVGSYSDYSDSAHIYGNRLKDVEEKFIKSALKQPYERRFWDLSTPEMQELLKEGEEKAYKLVKSMDEKNGRTNLPKTNLDM